MQADSQDAPQGPAASPDDLGSLGTHIDDALTPEALATLEDTWGRPRPSAAPRRSAMAVAALLIPMFYSEWPQNLLPGWWLGFLTLPESVLPAPLPPYWHAAVRAIGNLFGVDGLFCAITLAMLCVVLTASGTAALAALLYGMARQRIPARTSPEEVPNAMPIYGRARRFFISNRDAILQVVPGAVAGIACYLSYPAQLAWFSGGPEAMTAAMAVWGVYFYLRHYDKPGLPLGMMLAAFLIGAACVQQPYFLVLALLCLLHTALFAEDDQRVLRRVGALAFVFAFALALPTLELLRQGLAPRALLDHLLHLPYPDFSFNPGAFSQDYYRYRTGFYGDALLGILVDAILILVVLVAFLRRRLIRADAGFILLAAMLLGIGMRLIANPPRETLVPADITSPGYVGLALLLAAAVPAAVTLFVRLGNGFLRYPAILLATLLVIGSTGFERSARLLNTPDEPSYEYYTELMGYQPDASNKMGPSVYSAPNAIVLAGRLDFASSLWLGQHGYSLSEDRRVIPSSWLIEPAGRIAAQKILGPKTPLAANFPDANALERWQRALPAYAGNLAQESPEEFADELEAFAVWDLVAEESAKGQTYFVAVNFPWIQNRATLHGQCLVYPGNGVPDSTREQKDVRWRAPRRSPFFARLSDDLASSLFEVKKTRGALKWSRYHPELEETWKVPGSEIATIDAAYLRLRSNVKESKGRLAKNMEADFALLWRNDRLFLLRELYVTLKVQPDCDPEVYYQLAAVDALIGDWNSTRESLDRWSKSQPNQMGEATARFESDSRFDLYRRWETVQ